MKTAPYIFVLLFLPIAGYLMWKHFELPTIFFGDTKKIKGEVESINLVYGVKGIGRYQEATYFYTVNNSTYRDKFTADNRHGIQTVGDILSIEYSVDNPSKSKVVGFYKNQHSEKIKTIMLQTK